MQYSSAVPVRFHRTHLNVPTFTFTDGCFIPTTDGNANGAPCVFPFFYRGVKYWECTTINNENTPWCSTTTYYDVDKQWGNCLGIVIITKLLNP